MTAVAHREVIATPAEARETLAVAVDALDGVWEAPQTSGGVIWTE
jgi:hypothetical protein